jgi:hypothetical protein
MQTDTDRTGRKFLKMGGVGRLPLWKGARTLVALVIAGSLLAELIARSPLGTVLPPPSVGADSFEFDIKVYYLEQSIRERGSLDCLIVGDSMANDGPDPRLVEKAYRAETGEPLHCFNFGMPALTLESSGPLAEALNNRFQPRLLIFILSARDFDPAYGVTFSHVVKSDWILYNLGSRSLHGWAVNSLYAYRYFLFGQYWLIPPNRERFVFAWRDISPQGFTPLYGRGEPREITTPPPAFDPLMSAPAQAGLERLLQIPRTGDNLLVVDAPIRPDLIAAHNENIFIPYWNYMEALLASRDIPYWTTTDLSESIPEAGWYDHQHVNELGVPVLSAWLGEQLAGQYPPEFFR